MTANDFNTLHERVRRVARDVAAPHAGEVDQQARFPAQTLQALRESKVLSAGVPAELGGAGCNLTQMATLCATLSQACSASGMVLAMHLIQVGCLVRHGMGSAFFRGYLQDLVRQQWLLGSVTSEVGTFGDTRSSICAVQRDGQRFTLRKAATTVSYGLQSDALLISLVLPLP